MYSQRTISTLSNKKVLLSFAYLSEYVYPLTAIGLVSASLIFEKELEAGLNLKLHGLAVRSSEF